MWKSREDVERERFHNATVEAIHHASRRISQAITEGFSLMADTETQAVADLTSAIASLGDAIAAEIAALQKAVSDLNQQTGNPDSTAEISAAVTRLNDLTASLKASVAPAEPTPTPEPAPQG